ncbi:aminotransferase, class III superfamily [Synechococcus sp. PCC 7335]|uniref:aminotransferase n=1 Tax=Synechococcus sp. (strain ATCC 29403 / PCC 7335) TaxID=91464 RepID=UPI00017EB4DC|nr:aminotransferase [Synechococcus sp. PCC 7335]EDX86232.1 aminotransferase, class III superfamily [Synechococcus sp. PCC 7335]
MVTDFSAKQTAESEKVNSRGDSSKQKSSVKGELDTATLEKMDSGSLWHALSQHKPFAQKPPKCIKSGAGCYITDNRGDEYFDAVSGAWCVNIGYGRQELADVAYEQMLNLSYSLMTMSHEPGIRLAHKLLELLGYEGKVFFSTSGSEANETAFKVARQYHAQIAPAGSGPRYKFISRYRGYHGNSMGALSATAQAERKLKYEPLVPGFMHVNPPYYYRFGDGLLEEDYTVKLLQELEMTIRYEGEESIAAVIVEPIISGGGVIVPPDGYLRGVREICDRTGILLIYDEVVNGFGRTGRMFGHHHWGVEPDIITFAKGLTSGYMPLSATVVKQHIFEAFLDEPQPGQKSDRHFRHISTYGGTPVSTAVGLRNIEIVEREGLAERAAEIGQYLLSRLSELLEHPNVGDVRGKGLLLGIELVTDKKSKTPLDDASIAAVVKNCLDQRVMIGRNTNTIPGFTNVLIISPPLVITHAEADMLVNTIRQSIFSLS